MQGMTRLAVSLIMTDDIRVERRIEMETRLSQLHTPDAKEREIRKYSKTESQHLRLRRTKIKLTDFLTVKVIGKGAFGEVGPLLSRRSSD